MAEARVTPHDLDAERAVLGAVLVNGDRLLDIGDKLVPGDFFREPHQRIYAAMREMAAEGIAIDPLTLTDRLRQRGDLDTVGGPVYLSGLLDGVPRSTNIESYARIVKEKATTAGLMREGYRLIAAAQDDELGALEQLDLAQRALMRLSEQATPGDFLDAETMVREGTAMIETLLNAKQRTTGLATGYPAFDEMTRGLHPGTLVLVAARPSMGKSAWALNVAHHIAAQGQTVGFFSLEMSWHELFLRWVASVGDIDGHRLQSGYVHQDDYRRISDAFEVMGQSRLFVDDTSTVGVLDIRGKARRLQAKHGLGLIVVDYLQLMQVPRSENRNVAIAEVSRALKLLARELHVPVMALSQLSRDLEKRGGDKKPMLSDLRDSGSLEQDADLVVFIHRPEVYAPTAENEGAAELIVAKQRNGPTGIVHLRWNKASTRFESAA